MFIQAKLQVFIQAKLQVFLQAWLQVTDRVTYQNWLVKILLLLEVLLLILHQQESMAMMVLLVVLVPTFRLFTHHTSFLLHQIYDQLLSQLICP